MFQRIEEAEIREEAARVARLLKERFRYKPWTAVALAVGGIRWAGLVLEEVEKLDWKNRNMISTIGEASLYKGTEPQEKIRMNVHGSRHIFEDRPVVVFDDIVDTATTRRKFSEVLIMNMGAKMVIWCPMLQKEKWQKGNGQEFAGIWIPDDCGFLVGMGMDYNNKYRELEFVDTLEVVQEKENLSQAIVARAEATKDKKSLADKFGGLVKSLVSKGSGEKATTKH